MFFKNPAHKTRFLKIMQQLGKIEDNGKLDPEYAAALYILTADTATWNKAQHYVSQDGIDFPDLLAGPDWSHGHAVLAQLAGHLFNEQTPVSPVEFVILDSANFEVAIQAQRIRYDAPRIEGL